MITGNIRSKVDRIWDTMWSGGISNPLSVIEQLTYLLFIKRLDKLHILKESKAGSLDYAKGDIDLLVKFGKRKSLLSVVKLERHLAMALGRKVDLITEGALSPYIRDNIIHDLETIYAA